MKTVVVGTTDSGAVLYYGEIRQNAAGILTFVGDVEMCICYSGSQVTSFLQERISVGSMPFRQIMALVAETSWKDTPVVPTPVTQETITCRAANLLAQLHLQMTTGQGYRSHKKTY